MIGDTKHDHSHTETILNAALELLDMGFSVIPVRRDNKRPYAAWKEFQNRHPTFEEIETWWKKQPEANVAIVCGQISGIICVDADGPKGIDWINCNLPKTGVYSVTANGLHAIFAIPRDTVIRNSVRLASEVDIRGEGGYFVAPPSIHNSGHQYKWQFILDGWDDLAEYQPPTTAGNLNCDLTTTKSSPIVVPVKQGERNNTLSQLAGKWIAMGFCDEEVKTLARSWNVKNSPPLGEKELLRTLESIRRTHQRNHPECMLTPELEPDKCEESAIPQSILQPGGILQKLLEYIESNSAVAVPYFSLSASVTFLGNILGQKVMTESGLRTNLYCISLGYSGSGKNAAFSTLPHLLLRTDAYKTLGPSELTSSAAILRWLSSEEQRCTFMMLDEFGLVLKGLKNPNSAASDIPRLLTKLFSSTDRPEIKTYASGDTIAFPWHHLSLYGASTPERFWESMTPGEITDGFLARVLIWESLHDAPLPKTDVSFNVPKRLIKSLNGLYNLKIKTDVSAGNLQTKPVPNFITKTPEAQLIFNE